MSQAEIVAFLTVAAQNAGLSTTPEALVGRVLAEKLNELDELRHLRDEFHIPKMGTLPDADQNSVDPEEESIYLCGNSLGLMPKATRRITEQQFDKWSKMGVFGHLKEPVPWAHCDEACVEGIARVVGAEAGEVALMNGLTVNIHVFLTAFYRPTAQRHKILLEKKAFPSDHYAIESQIRLKGGRVEDSMVCLEPREGEDTIRDEDILAFLEREGESVAVVFFGGVQYYTGQLFDIPAITAAGHKKGCIVGWDLAHAFANVPLHLSEWDVDFAVWCTYKYGCTGAGGMAGAFLHRRFHEDKRDRMLGWWSHKMSSRFVMDNVLDLDAGINGYRISNPPIFLAVGVLGFLEVFNKTSMSALRAKSLKLTGYLQFLIEHHLMGREGDRVRCEIMTPSEPARRGCQLSLKFNVDIATAYAKLVSRGIAVDKRYPYVIRVAPVHLYNNYTDVWRFVQILKECVQEL